MGTIMYRISSWTSNSINWLRSNEVKNLSHLHKEYQNTLQILNNPANPTVQRGKGTNTTSWKR